MERDVIVLYMIAGVSFSFALFNCILFAIKHGKSMKTSGMIVSIKSTNPTNEKWRNAKLAEISYQVTPITVRYDRNQPERIYSYSAKRIITGFLIGIGSVLVAVLIQIH